MRITQQPSYTDAERAVIKTTILTLLRAPDCAVASFAHLDTLPAMWLCINNTMCLVQLDRWHCSSGQIQIGYTSDLIPLLDRVAILTTLARVGGLGEDPEVFAAVSTALARAIQASLTTVYGSLLIAHTPPTRLAIHTETYHAVVAFGDNVWHAPDGTVRTITDQEAEKWIEFDL